MEIWSCRSLATELNATLTTRGMLLQLAWLARISNLRFGGISDAIRCRLNEHTRARGIRAESFRASKKVITEKTYEGTCGSHDSIKNSNPQGETKARGQSR